MRQRSVYEPLIYALLVVFGVFAGLFWNKLVRKQSLGSGTKIEQVMGLVQNEYVDSVSVEEVEEKAISEMLSTFDPHSVYIPAKYVELANQDLKDGFDGIGIEFFMFRDTPYVVRVLEKGPAAKVDIRPGDRLLSADTSSLVGLVNTDVIKKIKGGKNSSFKARVYRKSEHKDFELEIKRGRVSTPSVYGFKVDDNTVYVRIEHFAEKTHKEFVNLVQELRAGNNAKDLIIDLRNNPGGYLQTAVELLDEIVDGTDLLAYTQSKDKRKHSFKATPGGLCADMDVICLVNGRSASASEIVSGALQDLDRAVVIGSQTFGKGLVQETFQLGDGSQIRLTVSRYYIPSGRSIQKPYDDKGYQHLDSAGLDEIGREFKTKSGRIVKSSGGITPDIILNPDLHGAYAYIGETSAELIDLHQKEWSELNSQAWMASDRVDGQIRDYLGDSTRLWVEVKSRLLYQLYGVEAMYKFGAKNDPVLLRARAEFKEPNVLLNPVGTHE